MASEVRFSYTQGDSPNILRCDVLVDSDRNAEFEFEADIRVSFDITIDEAMKTGFAALQTAAKARFQTAVQANQNPVPPASPPSRIM